MEEKFKEREKSEKIVDEKSFFEKTKWKIDLKKMKNLNYQKYSH